MRETFNLQNTSQISGTITPRAVQVIDLELDEAEADDEKKGRASDGLMEKRWRVKVYRLNEEGQWDDKGTGRAAVEGTTLEVLDEDRSETLLLSAAVKGFAPLSEGPYQKQGDNIITIDADPSDGGTALDGTAVTVALSFQEAQGCEQVWRSMGAAQTRLVTVSSSSSDHIQVFSSSDDDDDDDDDDTKKTLLRERRLVAGGLLHREGSMSLDRRRHRKFDESATGPTADPMEGHLLAPYDECRAGGHPSFRIFLAHVLGARGGDLGQLLACEAEPTTWQPLPPPRGYDAAHEWVCWLARAAPVAAARERYSAALTADGGALLRQFAASFDDAEDLDDVASLRKMADVAKLVILLNEPHLVDAVLVDPVYDAFLGALEYAADLKKQEPSSSSSSSSETAPPTTPARARGGDAAAPTMRSLSQQKTKASTPCSSLKSLDDAMIADDVLVGDFDTDDERTPAKRNGSCEAPSSTEVRPGTPTGLTAQFECGDAATTAAEARRVPLRELAQRSRRREVIPLDDELTQRIDQHVRARVLRDAVLRPGVDESQLSAVHSVVFWTTSDILRRLHVCPKEGTESYLAQVIAATRDPAKRQDAVLFLKEMAGLARGASGVVRDALYRAAVAAGLFDALADVVAAAIDDEDATIQRTCCVDILTAFLRVDAPSVRRDAMTAKSRGRRHPPPPPWLVERRKRKASTETTTHDDDDDNWENVQKDDAPSSTTDEKYPVLYWLCRLADDENEAVASLAAGSVRLVLESETMDDADRDAFLTCVYEYYMPWFTAPLFDDDHLDASERRPEKKKRRRPQENSEEDVASNWPSRAQICEALACCVRAHAYQIKYFLLRSNVVVQVASLASLSTSSRAFRLATVRFVRACIGIKDEFYARYLVKNGTLGPVLALVGTVKEDSLVACAVAELVHFVRAENVKSLVEHLVRHHADILRSSPTHAMLLAGLEQRLAQNEDALERAETVVVPEHSEPRTSRLGSMGVGNGLTAAQVARRERILLEDRDEAYFDDSDDEDDEGSSGHTNNKKKALLVETTTTTWPAASSSDSSGESSKPPPPPVVDDDLSPTTTTSTTTTTTRKRPSGNDSDAPDPDDSDSDESRSSKRSRTDDDDGFIPRSRSLSTSSTSSSVTATRSPAFFTASRPPANRRTKKQNLRVEIKWAPAPLIPDAVPPGDDLQPKRPRLDEPIATSS